MDDNQHLLILEQGIETWNEWRRAHQQIRPHLTNVNLCGAHLHAANFAGADLRGAVLNAAQLIEANLRGADLREAELVSADLNGADLGGADLGGVSLRDADLIRTILVGTNLGGANLYQARMGSTILGDVDLRDVTGLVNVTHTGPSDISISTIYRSEGQIPESFLRGCGVPDDFITFLPSLTTKAIEFYSCFISYSGKDEEFARRLHSRMREASLRVWFAPEDIKGGDKIYDQIDRAIQVHDRLLLVLSDDSLKSKWVETEIRRARRVELAENRRKLFPIRLVKYESLEEWVCIDSTTGEDLAEEVRSYFIPDFSNWKSHDDLEQGFARLLADLKASA